MRGGGLSTRWAPAFGLGVLLWACAGPRQESAPPAAAPPDLAPIRAEFEGLAERLYSGSNQYLGQAPMRELENQLADPDLDTPGRFSVLFRLANYKLLQNAAPEAVRYIDEALALLEAVLPGVPADSRLHRALPMVLRTRALAYLRLAEDQNCVAHHTAESCIFPIKGGGVHVDRAAAAESMASLERFLTLMPEADGERWLLNVAAMAAGLWPDAVPEVFRIAPERLRSAREVRRFVDVAGRLGVAPTSLAGGVIVDDFNGDGSLDIVTSSYDPRVPLSYFANLGDGRFEDRSVGSGLEAQYGGLNCIGADYDDDGDVDVLVLRGAWLGPHDGRIRNSLLRNAGDASFTDVTREAGLAGRAMPTQAALWGDFDNDGDLDLYVAHESPSDPEFSFPARLFRNNDDGTFTDIAAAAGVSNDRFAKGVTAGDYDNDGDLDLYVSNSGVNRLYRNNADGTFTDVAPELNLTAPDGKSFAPWFFDYDNDGWLDLFVGAFDASVEDIGADYMDRAWEAGAPALYHNNGDGSFTDVAATLGLDHPWLPMGANFGDIDNDGWLDLYLGTGDPDFRSIMPNILLRNDRATRFEDVTFSAGLGHLQKGHGIAFADLDHDGDQDIYHQLGGFVPGDAYRNALFLNPGPAKRFLKIRLVGTTSNRAGFGARIRVTIREGGGLRELHRAAGSVSSFGGSPTGRHEIGLGDAESIEAVEVWWPASNTRSRYTDVALDSLIEISEGSPTVRRLPHPRFSFTE